MSHFQAGKMSWFVFLVVLMFHLQYADAKKKSGEEKTSSASSSTSSSSTTSTTELPSAEADRITSLWARPEFRDPAAVDMRDLADEKLTWLYENTRKCSNMLLSSDSCGLITSINTPELYDRFVFRAPRPYHLFLLFTGEECCSLRNVGKMNSSNCSTSCASAKESFSRVAASYHVLSEHEMTEDNPSANAGGPAFFGIVDCNDPRMNLICTKAHKFNDVPKVVHTRGSTFRRRNQVIQFKPGQTYIPASGSWDDPEPLLTFVKGFCPREKLVLWQDLWVRLLKMGPLVFYGLLVVNLAFLIGVAVRKFPILMPIGGCAVQWLGCTGVTYCLINGWNYYSTTTGEMFTRSIRNQYVYEGAICSGLFMGAGLFLLCAVVLARVEFKKKENAAAGTLTAVLCLVVAYACWWSCFSIYQSYKAPWLSKPGFWPPPEYKTGPVDVDRGVSFVNRKEVAFYERSEFLTGLVLSIYEAREETMKYYAKFLKKCRKSWNNSALVYSTHSIMSGAFDLFWDPVAYVFGAVSSSSSSGGKKKTASKKKKKRGDGVSF